MKTQWSKPIRPAMALILATALWIAGCTSAAPAQNPAPTIFVECRILLLDEADFKFAVGLCPNLGPASSATHNFPAQVIDNITLNELLTSTQSSPGAAAVTLPAVALDNGQTKTVHCVPQNYVWSGPADEAPPIHPLPLGQVLEVKLTARQTDKAEIDLRADAFITVPKRPDAGLKAESFHLRTHVALPSRGTAIFGGIRVDSRADPFRAETAPVEMRYMVILVRPRFIARSAAERAVEDSLFAQAFDRPARPSGSP